jgi:hypothetical protein
MEGVGQVIEHQILELSVVDGHGFEQGLLVPNDIVVDEMVLQFLLFDFDG